jgi:hypothetical protein
MFYKTLIVRDGNQINKSIRRNSVRQTSNFAKYFAHNLRNMCSVPLCLFDCGKTCAQRSPLIWRAKVPTSGQQLSFRLLLQPPLAADWWKFQQGFCRVQRPLPPPPRSYSYFPPESGHKAQALQPWIGGWGGGGIARSANLLLQKRVLQILYWYFSF